MIVLERSRGARRAPGRRTSAPQMVHALAAPAPTIATWAARAGRESCTGRQGHFGPAGGGWPRPKSLPGARRGRCRAARCPGSIARSYWGDIQPCRGRHRPAHGRDPRERTRMAVGRADGKAARTRCGSGRVDRRPGSRRSSKTLGARTRSGAIRGAPPTRGRGPRIRWSRQKRKSLSSAVPRLASRRLLRDLRRAGLQRGPMEA